jgi:glycosyltransferase 2 family protein
MILVLLLTFLPFQEVWSAIRRIPPSLSLGLLIVYMGLHLIGVVKWRLLINLAGAELSFLQAVRCYYGGLFANNFLPSLVGGDLVRAGMAFLVSRSRAAVLLGSLIDRIMDVIGLASVAAIGVLLLPMSLDPQHRKIFWAVGGLLAAASAAGASTILMLPARKFPLKVRRIMVKVRRGVRSMYRHPWRVLQCLCLGVILQVCQVVINAWLGLASGLHVAFCVWLFAWPLAKLSALLPLTQGGVGVREAALVGLLAPFGASPPLSAAAGLVFEAITIVGGLIAGAIAFLIGRLSSTPADIRPELTRSLNKADRTTGR